MTEQRGSDRGRLRAAIASAVEAIRDGGGAPTLDAVVTSSARTARVCVLELAEANAQMLTGLFDPPADEVGDCDVVITVDHWDVGEVAIGIDELVPAARTATRVMLAIANGCADDVHTHLDIAFAAGGTDELRQVLAHTVLWTLELVGRCEVTDRPVPAWLAPVMTSG
jgi:hypothetical protein